MSKIGIREFCNEYTSKVTADQKKRCLKKLEITPYVPFNKKVALIENLTKITMIDKETGNIKSKSMVEYLLLTRIFIENYTNLAVETDGFYEEYDELKKSGLFDILLVGNGEDAPLIPYEEMVEFKHLLSLHKQDLMQNKYELHSFITEQVDRFKALGEATITPLMDVVSKKLDGIPKEDLDKVVEFAKNGGFKEV